MKYPYKVCYSDTDGSLNYAKFTNRLDAVYFCLSMSDRPFYDIKLTDRITGIEVTYD